MLYIGLISGTSMDGVDAALLSIDEHGIQIKDFVCQPYPAELLPELHALCQPGDNEIARIAAIEPKVVDVFARAGQQLLTRQNLATTDIHALGSHGQTIRHLPELGFTLQIGDPNRLAVLIGIDVVGDVRRKDMALGGQGAPLAPGFHNACFRSSDENRLIVNLGGIANLTYLPKDPEEPVIGYDTGPSNALMDAWFRRHQGGDFDQDGAWALQGQVHSALLKLMLSEPYLQLPAPKSTGRELFNLAWLEQQLNTLSEAIAPQDVQATLLEFSCQSLATEVAKFEHGKTYYLCGGGAFHQPLCQRLQQLLPHKQGFTTAALGIPPDQVEAALMAWLAHAYLHGESGNIPSVTGAKQSAILGGLYRHN